MWFIYLFTCKSSILSFSIADMNEDACNELSINIYQQRVAMEKADWLFFVSA